MSRIKQTLFMFCWLVSSIPLAVHGQSEMDSLKDVLATSPDNQEQASVLKQLSKLSFDVVDYESALHYLDLEVKKHADLGDSISWSNAQYSLGMVYSIIRQYHKASKHSTLALNFFEEKGMSVPLANTCINLGYINSELKHTDLAFHYYKRAIDIFNNLQNVQGIEASYLNIGLLGHGQPDLDSFKKNYDNSQKRSWGMNSSSMAMAYSALGLLSLQENDFTDAEEYATRGLDMAEKYKDRRSIAKGQILLGKVYAKQDRGDEAFSMAEKGLTMARQLRDRQLMLEAYAELARIAMSLDQPSLAYQFMDNYARLKDTLYEEQMTRQFARANKRFEINSSEINTESLLRENLGQAFDLQKNSRLKIALLISLLVILALVGVFFRRYHSRAKIVNELKDKNLVIEDQKTKLEQLILTKDRFLSIIAHDLKNPFNSLLGFADLAYTEFDDISDIEKKSYLNVIRQSGQHIYTLLDNLLTWSRAQSGRIDFNPEPVNLTETIESAVELVRSAADNKQISLFSDFTKDVIVKADKNMLSTILRNLLTNAIKFTPNSGSVSISCKNANNMAKVLVIDTGVGMTDEELSRLFRVDGNLKNAGTNSEIGTGLGLILCQEFMNLHKTKIIAESTPGKGSTFSFTLDLINLN